jgi:hypothetical protein
MLLEMIFDVQQLTDAVVFLRPFRAFAEPEKRSIVAMSKKYLRLFWIDFSGE